MARLDELEHNVESRTILYRDRYTGQKWSGRYIEQGFGSGYMLGPVHEDK